MTYDLIGIGNALVDIEAQVDDTLFEKFSFAKGTMILSTTEEQETILNTLADKSKKIASGGSAANTVHGFSVLGGKSFYIGRVANDVYGRHYTEDMNRCGVGFFGPGAETGGTGTSLILVTPDTERTMVTHLGVSASLHPDNVDPTLIQGASAVYIEGYLWFGNETRAAALKIADIAKKAKIPVAFTLSDTSVANAFKDALVDFIRWNVDILFCNETEACALAGTSDAESAFTDLKAMADTLFLTVGKNGAWAGNGSHPKIHVSAFPVTAVDTTGAGDLFAAGALYGLTKNHSLEESAILGSYCAAQVVSHMGARMPVHSHTNIHKILEQYRSVHKTQA